MKNKLSIMFLSVAAKVLCGTDLAFISAKFISLRLKLIKLRVAKKSAILFKLKSTQDTAVSGWVLNLAFQTLFCQR